MSPKPDEGAQLLNNSGASRESGVMSKRQPQSSRSTGIGTHEQGTAIAIKTDPLGEVDSTKGANKRVVSDPGGLSSYKAPPFRRGVTSALKISRTQQQQSRKGGRDSQPVELPEKSTLLQSLQKYSLPTQTSAEKLPQEQQQPVEKQPQEQPRTSPQKATGGGGSGGPCSVTTGSQTPTSDNAPPFQRGVLPTLPPSRKQLQDKKGERFRDSAPAEMMKLHQQQLFNQPPQKEQHQTLQPSTCWLQQPRDSQPKNHNAPPFRRGATSTPPSPGKEQQGGKKGGRLSVPVVSPGQQCLTQEPPQQQQQTPRSPPTPNQPQQPPTSSPSQNGPENKKAANNNSPSNNKPPGRASSKPFQKPPIPQRPLPALPTEASSRSSTASLREQQMHRQESSEMLPGQKMLHQLQLKSRLLHADILRFEADNYLPLPYSKKAAAAAGKKSSPKASPLIQPVGKPKPPSRSVAEMEAELFGLAKPGSGALQSPQLPQQQPNQAQQQPSLSQPPLPPLPQSPLPQSPLPLSPLPLSPLPLSPGPQSDAQPLSRPQMNLFSDDEGVYEKPGSFKKSTK